MKNKVKRVVEEITEVLKGWENVECVVLQHFAEKEIFDPNFSITLDVFRTAEIPDMNEREKAFSVLNGFEFFESSRVGNKDRFIKEELPVRISYKDTFRVDAVLSAVNGDAWLSMERGTYLFHRIATGTVVFSRSRWMEGVLEKLDNLPDSFWHTWLDSCERRIDHYLGDLGAAAMKDDPLYFRLSLSGFLSVAVEALFAINHVFETGPRDFTAMLALLEILPEGFWANWNSLLREDSELPAERKWKIAELVARGIFSLNT